MALRLGVYEVWYQVWGVSRDVWLYRDSRRQVLQVDWGTTEVQNDDTLGVLGVQNATEIEMV